MMVHSVKLGLAVPHTSGWFFETYIPRICIDSLPKEKKMNSATVTLYRDITVRKYYEVYLENECFETGDEAGELAIGKAEYDPDQFDVGESEEIDWSEFNVDDVAIQKKLYVVRATWEVEAANKDDAIEECNIHDYIDVSVTEA